MIRAGLEAVTKEFRNAYRMVAKRSVEKKSFRLPNYRWQDNTKLLSKGIRPYIEWEGVECIW
jgi:hypothetical protein